MTNAAANAPDRRALLQNALQALDAMQARLDAAERARNEAIAIVGLSCRFPGGANSPEAYWDLLCSGRDAVREVPADRWDATAFADIDPGEGKTLSWYGGFLDQIDRFEPGFFGISPREAASLDPQQRLVLEVSWEALERAGLAPDRLTGTQTGVFLGITTTDYAQLAKAGGPDGMDVYTATGTALNAAAGRIAYTLGLNGPAMAVDTACSSSLVAIHLACQSLRSGESDVALAGGVNAILTPEAFICFSRWGMMAPDGRCKTFDAGADGFVRGEGCGILVLKRLSDAQAHGDTILAVIRGSAVNQDGRSSGLTVPNGPAQTAVIRRAHKNSGITPDDVSYIEAHGTGTTLGDPIEVEAIGVALGAGRKEPLILGSVKSNIGHLESAAGIAGLIKVVLSLQNQAIPAQLHMRDRSAKIPWPEFPIHVPTQLTPWPRSDRPRVAGVSAFGFSGTNAHVVLAEAPQPKPVDGAADRPHHLLTLSAKTDSALRDMAGRWAAHLKAPQAPAVADLAYVANTGRARFTHRAAVAGDTSDSIAAKLEALASGDTPIRSTQAGQPRIGFLFTGQGAQYMGMGRRLYDTQPTFRAILERCADGLRDVLDRPLLDVMFADGARLTETAYTQPALYALEVALAELWRSWGVRPAAVMGHSIGEFAAAYVAGVFSLEDGLRLVGERGRLMQSQTEPGDMAAVFADEATVARVVAPFATTVSLAALNASDSVVISGAKTGVAAVLTQLEAAGIKARRLTVSHSFHSPSMDPILPKLEQIARGLSVSAPELALYSNVTGLPMTSAPPADYWARHARQPVRFADSLNAMYADGCDVFVEIGPSPTLSGLGQRCLPEAECLWLPSLRQGRDDWPTLLESLGALYERGAAIDWNGFERDYIANRRRVIAPTYPFKRDRFWIAPAAPARSTRAQQLHPLVDRVLASPRLTDTVYEAALGAQSPAYLDGHRLYGTPVFPGAGYLELGLFAAGALSSTTAGSPTVEALSISQPLILSEDGVTPVQVVVSPVEDASAAFEVFSQADGDWVQHATATIRSDSPAAPSSRSLAEAQARCVEELSPTTYYQQLAELGLNYGSAFLGIHQIWRGTGQALGRVVLPEEWVSSARAHRLHPGLLDSCLQLLGVALSAEPAADGSAPIYVPVEIERCTLFLPGQSSVWCHVELDDAPANPGDPSRRCNLWLFTDAGQLAAEVVGVRVTPITRAALERSSRRGVGDMLYTLEWRPQSASPEAGSAQGRWLILEDAAGLGSRLAAELRSRGGECVLARSGGAFAALDGDQYQARPTEPDDLKRLVTAANASRVVYLWGLDASLEQQDASCGGLLHLAQALRGTDVRLWMATRSAQSVTGEPVAVEQAPLWGLLRALAVEEPEWHCTGIDLDADDDGAALTHEILAESPETQVALRHGIRHVARLARYAEPGSVRSPQRLEIESRGSLDHLSLRPLVRRQPGPGEVEIQVFATGLNFRDVLNTLGMYPGDPGPLGIECAGIITAVGSGVDGLAIGDEVLALARSSFASYATTSAALVAHKPAALSWAQAAAFPNVFLTAHYALRHLGQLRAGERVLIHAAAGGVGLAAVQLALAAGAEVFATVGSPAKRAFLEKLGVRHIASSRTLDFADRIREWTGGQGVDVVLNSLAGDFVAPSLSILAAGGRFLEIGKLGLLDSDSASALGQGKRYFAVDLGQAIEADPPSARQWLIDLLAEVETGSLQPLPVRAFPLESATEAFRYMAQARHIGKVVLAQAWPVASRADSTYLITGGLGALGLHTARWLAGRGAGRLVLMSRSAPGTAAREAIAEIERLGATVEVFQADVSRYAEVAEVLRGIGPKLRGVVHAAGVLQDGLLEHQTWTRFEQVLAPKLQGAWNLHQLTAGLPLEFFIMYSAGAAVFGSAGQTGYAAANAFLDGLAHARRAAGLPVLSINWGAWSETGMAAALGAQQQQRWADTGIGMISPADGVRVLETLSAQSPAQVAVLPINWAAFARSVGNAPPPLVQDLLAAQGSVRSSARPSAGSEILTQLKAAAPAERRALLATHVHAQAARVFGLDPTVALDPQQGLTDLGMDSLMAVEFSNRLKESLGRPWPKTLAFEHPNLAALTQFLESELFGAELPTTAASTPSEAEAALEGLSADDLEQALLKELDESGY